MQLPEPSALQSPTTPHFQHLDIQERVADTPITLLAVFSKSTIPVATCYVYNFDQVDEY